ncbi:MULTISPECIES: SMP-30/gluconolactonase/LRE family protein [unclassified Actinomyces]|uniref:SMP-30/gluconolactonase/LRE family protein n=1 Tax=unclassified Actinomyces TaxID=2609248 RepID=UPI002017D4A4|nr:MULTISPECIES: SMP-30/gluconolactonase/LRE family protein [unclassified Actinomyces]MCL3777284.1 SMP-30/gluconolactonase/LRE family protein [Actinomyces sp. AC-20-1]MCL3789583.1 SMP-30/gluconolactonase/LRE family protein [Actinomyces sp. 187325]MCL3791868.1 SMP-30/gluconolactonase/LRE family protein [Actinomyces sp. 186855]MCL3793646.1 SMP-30/gluconolactonase/LRE family protein [Actinomyces sp. 217892]
MRAQRLTDTISYHGEGPVWWEATGRLRFVDMLHGAVIEIDDDGAHRRLAVPSRVASVIRPRVGGGALVATERGVALGREEDLSDLAEAVELYPDPTIRTNEGGCDPDGRFWIGTMSWERVEGAAKVYRWDGPGTEPVVAWGGATTANGLGFSPDGTRAYWVDTPTRTITLLDYDAEAGLVDPRPWVTIEEGAGKPDGLTVDAEGGVWVALHRGGAVRRYDAEGRLSEVVEVGVSKTTACTFGGADLDRLFITTSREDLPEDVEPAAGSVYVTEVGVKGLAPLPFNG